MDVFLLAGQSNMSGRGQITPTCGSCVGNCPSAPQRVINGHQLLCYKNDCWMPANDPLHSDKPDKVGVGPGLSFAKCIAELPDIVQTNRKIGLIPCAVGGSAIQEWLPKHIKMDNEGVIELKESEYLNVEDGIFEKTIEKTKRALNTSNGKDGMDIVLRAILWHQGESDCDTQQNAMNHQSATIVLFEQFRQKFGQIPIIVGALGDFLGKHESDKRSFVYYNIINQGLMRLPQMLPNIGFVSAKSLKHKGDFLYFDSQSAVILGERYAEKYAELIGSFSKNELIKYMRLSKFKNALKRHGTKAYESISFTTWFVGIAATTAIAVYVYKKFYSNDASSNQKR